MTKFLIVNADDFGLCREISKGIIKAYLEGIVTAASVVVNGKYFKEGIALLKDTGIDAGIHLTFTGSEKPLSGSIKGLVDSRGLFLKSYIEAIPRLILGQFDRNALEKELSEQIIMLKDNGIPVSHIDSHQHLHLLPGVRDIVTGLAQRFKIRWVRVTRSDIFGVKGLVMNILGNSLKKRLKKHDLAYADAFKGFEYGGRMNENNLSSLLKKIDNNGITEFMVHPGYDASSEYDWGYAWEDELKALTSDNVKGLIKRIGIKLTNFKELS